MDAPASPSEPSAVTRSPRNRVPIIVTIVLLVVVGAMLGVLHLRSTPEVAIEKIALALRTHDKTLFQEYVDVDQAVTQVLELMVNRILQEDVARGRVTKEQAEEKIHEKFGLAKQLATDGLMKFVSGEKLATNDGLEQFASQLQCDGKITNVRTEGSFVFATIRVTDTETDFTTDVVLKFQRSHAHLQVVGIENVLAIIDRLEKEKPLSRVPLAKKSPGLAERGDAPKEDPSKFLAIKEVALRKGESGSNELGFEVTIENTSAHTIVAWDFRVQLHDAQGSALFTVPFYGRHRRLRTGETMEVSSSRVLDSSELKNTALANPDLTALSTKTAISFLEFNDGTQYGSPMDLLDEEVAAAGPTEEETQADDDSADDTTTDDAEDDSAEEEYGE